MEVMPSSFPTAIAKRNTLAYVKYVNTVVMSTTEMPTEN